MSGILNVGTRALQANQIALQTAGNNIANVNTPGYSRQTAILQATPGQSTSGGYIGKGVDVQTIQRSYSAFLTRQSTLAGTSAAADASRADKLKQLESIFSGGANGLGAAVNDMLNAFSDVASAPTDLTARTVALNRVDETASRMRSASQNLDDLQQGVAQELSQKVNAVNVLAQGIADVNGEIARVVGSGQPPNDLLDQRDQLVREMNQYVQTTSIPADDGTVSIFLAGSQALVLGTAVAPVAIVKDDFGDPLKSKLAISRNGQSITLDETVLGGGEISGLLRFQNNDLNEGRNLLGRMTLAVSTAMNNQHKLGLDLNGQPGGNLFTLAAFGSANVLAPKAPASLNTGTATLGLGISDLTKFVASDYEMTFTSATQGNIVRRSDGLVTAFDFGTTNPVNIDGLNISIPSGTPAAGDRFLLKPFSTAASTVSSAFSSPRALAVASPIAGKMSSINTGTLEQLALNTHSYPLLDVPLTLKFIGTNQYIRSDDLNYGNYPDPSGLLTPPTPYNYTPGQAIDSMLPATAPLTGWSVTFQGSPKIGDTFNVIPQPVANIQLNAGNANAMLGLRDVAMFDGAALTDGYAGLIAKIGIRSQSANYSAQISSAIATSLEKDRTGVSGVNLDEEAAKLLQYQQAYQASAKMIQIAQNIFDTLVQSLGR